MVGGVEYVRGFVIWYDSDPKVTRIQVTKTVSGYVGLKNGWKSGSVALDSGHNGAAMQIDHLPNGGRRYRCNDGHPDDNFDDIVFRVDYVVEQST